MKERKEIVDQVVRERVEKDLGTSFCVEAGAGTGKTTILVSRYLSIIERGLARCGEIVAITFTEKAAAEMKIRLREKIEERISQEEISDDVRGRLENALYELERSTIGTIHSFASSILKEYPIESRVDPFFEQLDELGEGLLLEKCWKDFVESLCEEDQLAVRWFLVLGGGVNNFRELAFSWYRSRGKRIIKGMFSYDHYGGSMGRASKLRSWNDLDKYISSFISFLEEKSEQLMSLAEAFCVDREDNGYKAIVGFGNQVEALKVFDPEEAIQAIFGLYVPKNKGNKGKWDPPEKCTEQKEIFKGIEDRRDNFKSEVLDFVRDRLKDVFDNFVEYVEGEKIRKGVLDFDDLLIKARLLLDDERILKQIRGRFKYILVDEFQDTDQLQAEIVYLISSEGSWDEGFRIVPGKLFIVGDPKQSIYRFRGADVEVYEEFKQKLDGTGEICSITQNFRSVKGLVSWVNDIFSCIITRVGDEKYQSEYEPISAFRDDREFSVVYLNIPKHRDSDSADEARAHEARAIARVIHKLVDEGFTVVDLNSGKEVPVTYRHIAVIYPATTSIEHYENTLRDEEIPYIVEGGKLYFARQEIRDLSNALWSIEDPADSVALVSTLRSALFGFSDEEIFIFSRRAGNISYITDIKKDDLKNNDLFEALEFLKGLHDRKNSIGSYRVLKELLDKTNFIELSALRSHGEQRVLNIHKALQKARDFDSAGYSFRTFAEWLRKSEVEIYGEGESPVVEEDEDAVRLITMHKAKGLQFSIVILANLLQRVSRRERIYIVGGSRIEFKIGSAKTSGYDLASTEESKRELAERVRLLYVAATRAQDILVVPMNGKDNSYFGLISPLLPDYFELRDLMNKDTKDGVGEDDREGLHKIKGIRVWGEKDLPPLKATKKVFISMPKYDKKSQLYSIEEKRKWRSRHEKMLESGKKSKYRLLPVTALDDAGLEETVPLSRLFRSERDDALKEGLAFHEVMDRVVSMGTENVTSVVERVCTDMDILDKKESVYELVKKAINSTVLKEALSSSRIFTEVPFIVPYKRDLISGRIDLLYEKDNMWVLVDYKTDRVDKRDVEERMKDYRLQAGLYTMALNRFVGLKVSRVVFYFVRPDHCVSMESTGELVDWALERLEKGSS